jgi:hypothetical protein
MLAFTSIFLTALAALAGAPIWVAAIGAGILFSISLREQRKLSSRLAMMGYGYMLTAAAWQSAGHALIAAGAAWAMGTLLHLAGHFAQL